MMLTVERLRFLAPQDLIDLKKIWVDQSPEQWQHWLSDHKAIFAARFNDRLLAAVKVELLGKHQARLYDLFVREITRRRGVGRYLLEELQQQLPAVTQWSLLTTQLATPLFNELDNFMRACGFSHQGDAWQK